MEWQVIVALVLVVPIILIPVLFVWYLNYRGIYAAIKERRAIRKRSSEVVAEAEQHVAVTSQE